MNLVQDTKNWIQAPFTQQLDAVHVFLLTGLVLVSAFLWSRVVRKLSEYA